MSARPGLMRLPISGMQVMYDASGVRLHAGRQASVLNMIITELPPDHPVSDTRPLRDSLGHTPLQACSPAFIATYQLPDETHSTLPGMRPACKRKLTSADDGLYCCQPCGGGKGLNLAHDQQNPSLYLAVLAHDELCL